ncbi:unnamed protein product [Chondrus crispus]|uniref:Uncharacterized protein n=1 Tax=Chondrus crispus TaxID=2769 RepID=R7QSV7_CHOCR|nr:unnamed protein product [Chondrus crispus]CDF40591.1 unnamed protein product [Chondrus crispus]|eukprot:XP_005710885.1 unnamed protein product [Chondrus crispus]
MRTLCGGGIGHCLSVVSSHVRKRAQPSGYASPPEPRAYRTRESLVCVVWGKVFRLRVGALSPIIHIYPSRPQVG